MKTQKQITTIIFKTGLEGSNIPQLSQRATETTQYPNNMQTVFCYVTIVKQTQTVPKLSVLTQTHRYKSKLEEPNRPQINNIQKIKICGL